ncbi:hypothetical protein AB1484_30385, partial [Parafrankia sp. FMc6]|uniref:hypothetical protein n=1 Tax=Parafrankia soli TaxID=2599596 RepID=UPI0034D530D6
DTPGPYDPINHATPTPQDRQAIKPSQSAGDRKINDLQDLTSYLPCSPGDEDLFSLEHDDLRFPAAPPVRGASSER